MAAEMKKTRAADGAMMLAVDYDHCSYCGACVAVCPPDAIVLHDATLLIEAATCTLCERCIPACPTGALTLTNQEAANAARI
jgi:ferredoxin